MDGRQGQGGYERTPGGFGSDFISLGPDSGPDNSNNRWPPWNRRGRGRGIHQSFNRPYSEGPNQPFHAHHMRGQNRGRGNQNFRGHQGPRQPRFDRSSDIPISAYYHPSMVEDPWEALENLFKGQHNQVSSSNMECDNLDKEICESEELDSKNSGNDSDSE